MSWGQEGESVFLGTALLQSSASSARQRVAKDLVACGPQRGLGQKVNLSGLAFLANEDWRWQPNLWVSIWGETRQNTHRCLLQGTPR